MLLDVFKVCKLQKRAEQFMKLFSVFELKILGYYNQWKVPAILIFYKKINSATWKEQKN